MDTEYQVERGGVRYHAALGHYAPSVAAGLARAERDEVARRVWARDMRLWPGAAPPERLGWLDAPVRMADRLEPLQAFADEVRAAGFRRVLLLGVGAPYLALELVRAALGQGTGLSLHALGSTDADAVLAQARALDPATLLVIADKLGGAVETLSLFKFFYTCVADTEGAQGVGRRFITVCDPGDPLAKLASVHGFRAAFLNDPDLPGCYAALSLCGLLPAALCGADLGEVQRHALAGAAAYGADLRPEGNAGVWLGTVLGTLAQAGRDKVTFVVPETLGGLGAWLERLLAEATGKVGRGLVPVTGEPLGAPEVYSADRVFVSIKLEDDAVSGVPLEQLGVAGHPVLRITLPNKYDVVGQLLVWQFAVAVAAYHLGVDPFALPDTASTDARVQELVEHYKVARVMPDGSSAVSAETLLAFLAEVKPGDYITLQAYLPPSEEVIAGLKALRVALRDRYTCAVTCAFGPQYLHSTGQLHKGGRGVHVVQLVSEPRRNAPIPDEAGMAASSLSFYLLKRAQALGDKQALEEAGRRVIQFNLGQRVAAGLEALSQLP